MAKQIKDYTAFTSSSRPDLNDLYVIQKESTNETMKVKGSNMLADEVVTTDKIDWSTAGNIWWQELGRATLTTEADSITLPTITARKYLQIIARIIPSGGTANLGFRFNADAANYAYRGSLNGAADTTGTSQTYSYLDLGAVSTTFTVCVFCINIATQEKLIIGTVSGGNTTGAGTAPSRREYAEKWADTTQQITDIIAYNAGGTGNFGIGSEVIVLGHD